MSNALAIAAVTNTLQKMLTSATTGILASLPADIVQTLNLSNLTVTTRPLDRARPVANDDKNQLNLFLYQTTADAAWRNMDLPRQVRSGETALPSLALSLHYLLSVFPSNSDDTAAHVLLGQAMRIFHDNGVLDRNDIHNALADNDLDLQVERVRITPLALSVEEISKLWTAFATSYRVSAAYEVSVVLIESGQPINTPLPVLKRGAKDQGVTSLASSSPSLIEIHPDVHPPGVQASASLGDTLILSGQGLGASGSTVRFTRQAQLTPPATPETVVLQPLVGGNDDQLRVTLAGLATDPSALSRWAPGFYNVCLVVGTLSPLVWVTNEVPFALAPSITLSPLNAPAGDVLVTVTCAPRLRDGQRVILLFGNRQIPIQSSSTPADTTQPTTLTFLVPAATAGTYVVRLRVDGVDSLPVVRTGPPPGLEFDPKQTVTIK